MKYEIMANVPDQDHVRTWCKIGECDSHPEFNEVREKFIRSNPHIGLRMKAPKCFKLVEKEIK